MNSQFGFSLSPIACFLILALFLPVQPAANAQDMRTDVSFADVPAHVVLIVVDGLSYKTWDKVDLPVMKRMIETGALLEKTYLPPAAHPQTGVYAEIHTASIPNPIMMSGTVFIDRSTVYLQEAFFPDRTTAFVANTLSYRSLNTSYHYSWQESGPDDAAIERALGFMALDPVPAFMRVHLQRTGGAGSQSLWTDDDVPWRYDIWADGSPYRKSLAHADSLLAAFVRGLDRLGILEKTTLVILGDHGQNDSGWHPPQFTDSSITTCVLWGAGVRRGARISYSELIDIVPTICSLAGVGIPATSIGRTIVELLSKNDIEARATTYYIRDMLEQFAVYRQRMSRAHSLVRALDPGPSARYLTLLNRRVEEDFYGIDRFTEWPVFSSLSELVEANKEALDRLAELTEELEALE